MRPTKSAGASHLIVTLWLHWLGIGPAFGCYFGTFLTRTPIPISGNQAWFFVGCMVWWAACLVINLGRLYWRRTALKSLGVKESGP